MIITRGFGEKQLIVTRGYGQSGVAQVLEAIVDFVRAKVLVFEHVVTKVLFVKVEVD